MFIRYYWKSVLNYIWFTPIIKLIMIFFVQIEMAITIT